MKKFMVLLLAVAFIVSASPIAMAADTKAPAAANEDVLFSFEQDAEGWYIPDWALEKPDHCQKDVKQSSNFAKHGSKSLEMTAEFPGGKWAGAIIEVSQSLDWTKYKSVSCDIFIPKTAPQGLKGKIILTVGESWKWVEMSKEIPLVPGEWTNVNASIIPGSIDWSRTQVDEAFRADIRKVDIRVTSNKPAYSGPIYIDNIKLVKK